jgi:hypothetical protein
MKKHREWIERLEASGFVKVDGLDTWIECLSQGWAIIIQPMLPCFKTWRDIEREIERQRA